MKLPRSSGPLHGISRRIEEESEPAFAPPADALSPAHASAARAGKLLSGAHALDHPRSASVRALRAELLLRRGVLDRADVLVLLSPGAGEGRSLLAADLAVGMAQSGAPTLLVDADLRRPQQHLLFGTTLGAGLAQALASGQAPALRATLDLPALTLLTAGAVPLDPLELLSRPGFQVMVEQWRNAYRFVVIDTPPVASHADGLVIANVVGRVLVLTRAQHTLQSDLQSMLDRLAGARSDVVGAVLSRF